MSSKYLLPLHFNFGYTYLIDKNIAIEAFLRRDQAALNDRGVTVTRIDAMLAERLALIAIPTSAEEKNTANIGYAARNVKAQQLFVALDEVVGIAKTALGETSPEYKSFGAKGMGSFSPTDLYVISKNIMVKAALYTAKMTPLGLTTAMITNITTLRDALIILISATPILDTNTYAVTDTRRIAANLLFDDMRSLCDIALIYYKTRDSGKLKDYTIYDAARTTVDRMGTVLSNNWKSPKATPITEETMFNIKVKTGTRLKFYFSMAKGAAAPVDATVVAMNPNIFTTLTASDLGYDSAGGITILNIRNDNSDSADFLVKMG